VKGKHLSCLFLSASCVHQGGSRSEKGRCESVAWDEYTALQLQLFERALQCLMSSYNCLKGVSNDYQLFAARRKSLCCHPQQPACTGVVLSCAGVLPPCMARLCCLRAWHRRAVSMHGKVVLSLCMGMVLSACIHGYNVVCSRCTCQPPLNSLQLLFHSSCLNPSPVSTLAMRLSASYPPAASNLSIAACRPSSAPLLPAQTVLVTVLGAKPPDQGKIGKVSRAPLGFRFEG